MIRRLLISILRGYQYVISPWLGNRCRFHPSCSEYMIEAVRRFGVFKGLYLGFKRLVRCQPMCEGGLDPVPEEYPRPSTSTAAAKDPKNKDQSP
ncbi:membrane protein insertion efficiency factor YidD [Marinicella meishanensis]|uniref:membrane protein insertion efficiency factor YidD n=1 Tax=Marinicella meishanensis TaxID=2873263 RepID=UPI001CBB4080|nr:membrane protein insertion efficiency factor YidD [Marinicella sp. NBU2979]